MNASLTRLVCAKGLSAANVKAIRNFSLGQVGTQYSIKEAVRTVMWGALRSLANEAYQTVEFPCSGDDILTSVVVIEM